MGKDTKIAWCDDTFNPWVGCMKISEACKHCYAAVSTPARTSRAKGLELWGPPATTARKRTSAANWKLPLRWNREAVESGVRRRVFCASLADVFEAHPDLDVIRADLWKLVEACAGLDWLLLTKRPEHIRAMVPPSWLTSWPAHVWVGTTVEDQKRATERIPHLLSVPARVRFLSCEPLLGALDLSWWIGPGERLTPRQTGAAPTGCFCSVMACPEEQPCPVHQRVSWVIVGGESGPGARPFDLAWARSIVGQCEEAGVPCFVNQMGDNAVETERVCPQHSDGFGCGAFCKLHRFVTERVRFKAHHGADPAEWPEDLRVQEFPR